MTRIRIVAIAAPAAVAALALSGCSSTSTSTPAATTTSSTSSTTEPPANTADGTPGAGAPAVPAATTCPTAPPAADAKPQWTLQGTSGSLAVVGATATTAPRISLTTPFAVATTQVKTLSEGTGAVVAATDTASVCYAGVDGRDGKTFDSSYERGAPEKFPVGGVVPGFSKALVGQKVGSSVAVAITSADGYPDGMPAAGIAKGDTLVFALTILSAN